MIQINYRIIWALVAVVFSVHSNAQEYCNKAFFTTREMPDLTNILPNPPGEGTDAFAYDIKRYLWGKEQRKDSVRTAIAIQDAVYGVEYIAKIFSVPFGMVISREDTPAIYQLLEWLLSTCDSICTLPKVRWHRTRPFVYFDESTLVPKDEATLRYNGSYPSGHTILGYSASLLLTEINPERADTLLSRGMMYGESRVIVGAHWQSDVDAGRLAASMAYAKLHTSKSFLKYMKRAKKEFNRLKRKSN